MISTRFCLLLVAAILTEMTSASHVVKRSDDKDPYAAVISTLSQEVTRLQARLQSVENALGKHAAFRAVLHNPVVANAPIRFDLDYNLGGGQYDAHTGIYTVAIPGAYSLGFQLFPEGLASFVIDLYINGAKKIRSRCYDSTSYPTSCSSSSFFRLGSGDKVWVQTDHGGSYYPTYHTFFYGALISPDP